MQAVILAAGRGTRMGALTDTMPKPMLQINGRTLLEHKFDALPEAVDELILIIGYLGDVIRTKYGNEYRGRNITYIEQTELNGTMGALLLAKERLAGPFLVMMGDDLYSVEDIERVASSPDWAVLIQKTNAMAEGGSMVVNEEGIVTGIEEGDHRGRPGIMNTNLFKLDERIFEHPPIPKQEGSGEFGLPQTVVSAASKAGIALHTVSATGWFQVTAPEDLTKGVEDRLNA